MKNAQEALKTAALTLERYRKNKTLVSPEELQGKYKIPFQKLKSRLKTELEEYLKIYCLSGMIVNKGDCTEFVEACRRAYKDAGIGRAIGKAAFQNFDIKEVERLAGEYRQRIGELYEDYFQKHTCVYAYGKCFEENNPGVPLIYNDLVDKFFNEATGTWIDRTRPEGGAILIFVKGKETKSV